MTRRIAVALLALSAAFSVRAACPESGGIGGTGIRPQSELGIIGVITAFGSICVNNVEIEYNAATPVALAGVPGSPASLAIGQVVAVQAIGGVQRAQAQRIDILDAAVGPVQTFDASSGVLHVAGQSVHVGMGTVFANDLPREALAQRPSVRVSGLWRADGTLEATRIERAPDDVAARVGARDWPRPAGSVLIVEGYVHDAHGERINVGGIELERAPGAQSELRRDDRVRVIARMDGGRPVLERSEVVRGERPERSDRPGRPERVERGGSGRPERPERIDRSGRH